MSTRVLATAEAEAAIGQMASALSDYDAVVSKLKGLGQTLSDPNVWDGGSAAQFRGQIWPQCTQGLDASSTALAELQSKMSQITQNIMAAGGG